MKSFDPLSQRMAGEEKALTLSRLSECVLTPETLERFKRGYRLAFPSINCLNDPPFQALTQGRTYPGMVGWNTGFPSLKNPWCHCGKIPPQPFTLGLIRLRRNSGVRGERMQPSPKAPPSQGRVLLSAWTMGDLSA